MVIHRVYDGCRFALKGKGRQSHAPGNRFAQTGQAAQFKGGDEKDRVFRVFLQETAAKEPGETVVRVVLHIFHGIFVTGRRNLYVCIPMIPVGVRIEVVEVPLGQAFQMEFHPLVSLGVSRQGELIIRAGKQQEPRAQLVRRALRRISPRGILFEKLDEREVFIAEALGLVRRDDLADGIRRDVLHIHRAGQIEGAVEGSVPFQFRQVGTRRTGLVALQSCFHVKSGPEAVLVFETLFNIVGKAPPEIGQYVNLAHAGSVYR